jgi:tRNA nucleotidyltransferase (CCA-adding enzyme)
MQSTTSTNSDFLCYQVGGSVRDSLLGIVSHDRDWVVIGERAENLLALGYKQVGADFPVFLHPVTQEEYALARTERKTGPGYRGFSVLSGPDVTLKEDLIRRDLTINAMALDTKGKIIDPFGGQKDLDNRILRHVSPAFAEDPLRVLRVARFMARFASMGFSIATETLALMSELACSGVLKELTPERIWIETQKALSAPNPSQFFQVLHSCKALAEIFPELSALVGQQQLEKFHPEGDAWTHTILSLDAAAGLSQNTEIRFAALMHDIGKGETPPQHLPSHHGHEDVGADRLTEVCQRIKAPKSFEKLAIITARHHMQCHKLEEMRPKRIVKLLGQLDGFKNPKIVDAFIIVCTADKWGRGEESRNKPYRSGELLKKCLDSCRQIDNQPLLEAGYQGRAFGDALHKIRIQRVCEVMDGVKKDS